jgi:hypothetical protein
MEKTLFEELVKQGITVNSHYSDLYFPVTEQTTAILKQFPDQKGITTVFTNQVEGGRWYDTSCAFLPYWEEAFQNFPKSIKNSNTFMLENANATIGKAIYQATGGQ